VWALVVAGILGTPASGFAQTTTRAALPAWRPLRPVLSIGGGWIGADALGSVTAETRSAVTATTTPPRFPLFRTQSTLGGAPRVEVAVGIPATSSVLIEVLGSLARPTLSTAISGDAEGARATTATELVDEYTVGTRAIWDLRRWEWWGRARPFVTGGGAYLRQLHEDRVLVETGQVWSAGAGLRYWLRRTGPRPGRAIGLTGEAGWAWRTGGIAFVDGARSMPTVALRAFVGF
jgi:hypothetical protein